MMRINRHKIEIIPYSNKLKAHIKILNYQWLEKFFRIEKGDLTSLSNPKEEIIDQGGFIFYARVNNQIIGAIALIKKTSTIYEIGKMAVAENSQGLGVGTLLLEHCIKISEEKKFLKLILYSNTALKSAMYLYEKYGFIETKLEEGLYERANIKMVKNLT